MMRSFIFTSVLGSILLLSQTTVAQEAKVIKVQGKKAIVLFPDDARPQLGQTFDLSGGSGSTSSSSGGGSTATRNMIIGGTSELSSITRSTSNTSSSVFSFDGRYGWNKAEMEYGPTAGFAYASSPGVSARTFRVGGFFDFNLVPNKPGTEIVYGVGAEASYGSTATATGSTERSTSDIYFDGGGQIKWFPLGKTVAIRGDVVYRYRSYAQTTNFSDTGFVAKAGLLVYFW